MDSVVNYIEKTFKTDIPNIFRFENPSYGFNYGEKTYITPDLTSISNDKFFIDEGIIDGFLDKCKIVFVGVVGNRKDLYKNNGIYQSNVMIRNISLYGIQEDGSFVDLIRKLKFDTKHPDMIFYPLCSYIRLETNNALHCILNDELMTIGEKDDQASLKSDYPYFLIDPFTNTVKDEILSFKCIDSDVKIAKSFILLPPGKTSVDFNIFKDTYDALFGPFSSDLLSIDTNGVATVSGNILNIKVVNKFTTLNVVVNLHGLFGKSIKGERLEFECLIIGE
jgi:hypothetical protein